MKKIFIITGEASGDKLASKVIFELKKINPNIEYSCVGGSNLESLNIKSIFDLKEITYIGFTSVFLNLFKIRRKINQTIDEIIKFKPDILFSVDSPDFTLRVAEKVKKINPSIKSIHYVAPQIWIWREKRVKKYKKFLDHLLLLFNFEKKYFDKENIKTTFVGHPLLETKQNHIDISNLFKNNKKIISIFAGSRNSEVRVLTPILINFIILMNQKNHNYNFVFHATNENKNLIKDYIKKSQLDNVEVLYDEKIKYEVLSKSIFAVAKSGTISLEICNLKIPSIIIYKINYINYYIMKLLVKVKYANIINIINNEEIIPELLQKECNANEIYKSVIYLLKNPTLMDNQVKRFSETLNGIKSATSSSSEASKILNNYLI
ncbi:lipid-A-disaccharide synthase [Candidatus Pelagibacter sp.]|uniref:lipid-A-disaccharide synthase n=1 Tax=Candidatus Pelagibacter sp. TaxID=2024849 RepID=UPI003F84975E